MPEQAQLALPAMNLPTPPMARPAARRAAPAPLFLFDPPQPVEVIASA
jgi:hypothetical protein